jgi:hypothetical protein
MSALRWASFEISSRTKTDFLSSFNFFLDEMISIHNDSIVEQLMKTDKKPHLQEEALLRGASM